MAAFHLIIYGRFWVITEVNRQVMSRHLQRGFSISSATQVSKLLQRRLEMLLSSSFRVYFSEGTPKAELV
jgi:DNA repair protein RadC